MRLKIYICTPCKNYHGWERNNMGMHLFDNVSFPIINISFECNNILFPPNSCSLERNNISLPCNAILFERNIISLPRNTILFKRNIISLPRNNVLFQRSNISVPCNNFIVLMCVPSHRKKWRNKSSFFVSHFDFK